MRDLYYEHYSASEAVQVVQVPPRPYLMLEIDGSYEGQLKILRLIASALSSGGDTIYAPMPLEGLWTHDRASPATKFDPSLKHAYCWRAGICLPPMLTDHDTRHVRSMAEINEDGPKIVRFGDGSAVQVLHKGTYESSGPAIATFHQTIASRGARPVGAHHEIYLTDPVVTPPEEALTILRQPFRFIGSR